MLKKAITYVDYDGVTRTEDFYFNLTKTELTEMENSVDGGMKRQLEAIVASENVRELLTTFKKIIVASHGIKSADGKLFRKSPEISEDFLASPAFDVLFMSLAQDANLTAEFINGMMPNDISGTLPPAMNSNDSNVESAMSVVKD